MITYLYKIVILLFFGIFFFHGNAQNVDFSQTNSNFVYLNPAFSGIETCPKLYTSYRIKELSIEGGYMTNYISTDMYLPPLEGDISLSFMHDIQQNTVYTTGGMMAYAKQYKVHKYLYLKAALGAGFTHTVLLKKNQVYSSMLHPLYGETEAAGEPVADTRNFFDTEAGLLLYNDWFYAGATWKHINHINAYKNAEYIPYVPQVSIHGGGQFSSTKGFEQSHTFWFYPHVNVTMSRVSSYALFSTIARKEKAQFGLGYKQNLPVSNESFLIFVGFVEKKYKFAYNCDVVIKSKVGNVFNSHEFSLTYQFGCLKKRKKYGAVKAPGY
ncbi:MAG: PorP/SprF family type IX secretion system membrane protein [Bacteroidales bacterium]